MFLGNWMGQNTENSREQALTVPFTCSDDANGIQDNFESPLYAYHAAVASGMVHSVFKKRWTVTDNVPVDIVANLLIAVGWFIGCSDASLDRRRIFNCTSGSDSPVSAGDTELLLQR
jgi:hypothetical protein